MFLRIAELPRKFKILIMLGCDVVLLPLALWSAVALRLGTFTPDVSQFWWVFFVIPFTAVPIFIRFGFYRAVIRYMDDKIIYTVIYGVSLSVLMLMAVVVMAKLVALPRSSIVIYWVIAIAYIGASRFVARGLIRTIETRRDRKQNVAIYGAGQAGLQTALALVSGREYRPVAFFDDNPELQGTSVAGLRVYPPKEALKIMQQKGCEQLLIAMPSSSRTVRKEIISRFEGKDIVLKILPGLGDLVQGKVRVEDIREVGVEDLLGRDPVPPFEQLISSCIKGRVVLVTGAGGSIGSELCRQILLNSPLKLILFERSEFALYKIEQELTRLHPEAQVISVLGDVLDQEHLENLMTAHAVQTVYHAAAYKHVPLVEANADSGILNNVFGTRAAAKAAINTKVSTFVLISTDKAVRPTNVMGASKRLAELVLQGLAHEPQQHTRICMVRFGNVLGSSGSVVPLFKEQIKNGGPVTVTHPEVTRYFMTIPEAAQLVLQAGSMGKGGDVFVLDMGEPVKIVDLARKMVELSGLEVREPHSENGDIAIEFVGLRPGEKLYEELLIGDNVTWTEHPRIMRAEEHFLEENFLKEKLTEIQAACKQGDSIKIRGILKSLVKEYTLETFNR
ncbi:MAG TPA: nucleoside-diphosphate sugar epimerase/dehydratase [Pseudobdellovibrionaceae bacterium]